MDVACGPGNISQRIAKNWPLVKVVGIDGSKEMLNQAEKKLHENFMKNLTYELIDINSIATREKHLPFKADVLVSNSALHHFHDPYCFWLFNCSGKRLNRPNNLKIKLINLKNL